MRLTNNDRTSVLQRALDHAFLERKNKLKKDEDALARSAYEKLFPKKTRDALAALPSVWLRQDNCLMFSFRGLHAQLCLIESHTLPIPYDSRRLGEVSDEATHAAFLKLQGELGDYNRAYKEAKSGIWEMLLRFGTLKTLREGWPDGAKFYDHLKPREDALVPALQVSKINEMLGLKVGGK